MADSPLVHQTIDEERPVLRHPAGSPEGGNFRKGTAPGPGRTDLADRGRYLRAVKAAVTHDDLVNVLTAMVKKAVDGDVAAGRLICEYTLGRPSMAITIGGEDGPAYKVLIGVSEGEL